jgi:HD domain
VVAGGACTGIASAAVAWTDLRFAGTATLFAVAGTIAESFHVLLPATRSGQRFNESVSTAVSVAALLTLPVHWAVLVVATACALGYRPVWFKLVFNAATGAVATGASGAIWHLAGSSPSRTDVSSIPWMLAAVGAYIAINSAPVAAIVGMASGMPVHLTWWRSYRHLWPATLGIAFVGVLISVLWTTSAWAIALAAIPLTALYYTLRNTVSLETQTREALFQLADILDARDPYTHGHSLRVGEYAEKLALAMGLPGDQANLIYLSGRLHDIGKCAVRNEVLLKPAALDEEERAHMCIHPEVGSSMLNAFSLFKECAAFVRGHHERWDGTGYPDGLKGENIPIGARVIAVPDAYDAMTTTRPYRTALPQHEAFRRLREGAGSQWDARAVQAFLGIFDAEAPAPASQAPAPAVLPVEPSTIADAA